MLDQINYVYVFLEYPDDVNQLWRKLLNIDSNSVIQKLKLIGYASKRCIFSCKDYDELKIIMISFTFWKMYIGFFIDLHCIIGISFMVEGWFYSGLYGGIWFVVMLCL